MSAESAGAILPSAAPIDIPPPICWGYAMMLSNLLLLIQASGPPQDDVRPLHIEPLDIADLF